MAAAGNGSGGGGSVAATPGASGGKLGVVGAGIIAPAGAGSRTSAEEGAGSAGLMATVPLSLEEVGNGIESVASGAGVESAGGGRDADGDGG
jgi:hypothetical protein